METSEERFEAERRRRLVAERKLEALRADLGAANKALADHADTLASRVQEERRANQRLLGRTAFARAQRDEASSRAEQARRRLWLALEATQGGFALFDSSRRLLAANEAYLAFLDEPPEHAELTAFDLFGRAAEEGVFDIEGADPAAWTADFLARWDEDPIPRRLLQRFDGRAFELTDRRSADGDIVSVVADTTEIVAREAALREARAHAEAAARAKTQFLARMSHEMRTPLNGVMGMSDLLAERALDDESRLCVQTIRSSAHALLTIVNDILDLSRAAAGRMTFEAVPFDLEAVMLDALRLASAAGHAERKGLTMALQYPFAAPRRFVGDPTRLAQIMLNLLGNAVKFTERGHVAMRLQVRRPADGEGPAAVVISVEDTGCGIPAESLETIFDEFVQADDPASARREGTGLGLAITRAMVEGMGGAITFTTRTGAGTCFRLELPLLPAEPWPAAPALPTKVALPLLDTLAATMLAETLWAVGVEVMPSLDAPGAPVIVPLDAPRAAQAELAAHLGGSKAGRVLVLGNRREAAPELLGRADIVLPRPCSRDELVAALGAGEPSESGTALADARAEPVPEPSSEPGSPPLPMTEAVDPAEEEGPPGDRSSGKGEPDAQRRTRVLMADDNATNRLLLRKMLEREDLDLEIVDDGAQAVESFAAWPADVVFLDLSMPVMDGDEAFARIRAMPGGEVPIVAMTAHATADDAGLASRFDAFLVKPLRRADILGYIPSRDPEGG